METKYLLEYLMDFYNSEKQLYFAIIIIGVLSAIIGLAFYYLSSYYKVFGISLLILGVLEAGIFTYSSISQKDRVDRKVECLKADNLTFFQSEKANVIKAQNALFGVKMVYAILIILSVVVINYSNKTTLNGVLMALILHLALAITVDNFAERYTKNYHQELINLEQ